MSNAVRLIADGGAAQMRGRHLGVSSSAGQPAASRYGALVVSPVSWCSGLKEFHHHWWQALLCVTLTATAPLFWMAILRNSQLNVVAPRPLAAVSTAARTPGETMASADHATDPECRWVSR